MPGSAEWGIEIDRPRRPPVPAPKIVGEDAPRTSVSASTAVRELPPSARS